MAPLSDKLLKRITKLLAELAKDPDSITVENAADGYTFYKMNMKTKHGQWAGKKGDRAKGVRFIMRLNKSLNGPYGDLKGCPPSEVCLVNIHSVGIFFSPDLPAYRIARHQGKVQMVRRLPAGIGNPARHCLCSTARGP